MGSIESQLRPHYLTEHDIYSRIVWLINFLNISSDSTREPRGWTRAHCTLLRLVFAKRKRPSARERERETERAHSWNERDETWPRSTRSTTRANDVSRVLLLALSVQRACALRLLLFSTPREKERAREKDSKRGLSHIAPRDKKNQLLLSGYANTRSVTIAPQYFTYRVFVWENLYKNRPIFRYFESRKLQKQIYIAFLFQSP